MRKGYAFQRALVIDFFFNVENKFHEFYIQIFGPRYSRVDQRFNVAYTIFQKNITVKDPNESIIKCQAYSLSDERVSCKRNT